MGAALLVAIAIAGALALGLLLGRYYVPDDRMTKRTAKQSKSYMRALSHLIARDRDAAIAELRTIVSENVDDVEPYFALGSLFRARGETERAIRVHQALAIREKDRAVMHARAMYELALDFRAAGMPKRATKALEAVVADDSEHLGALRALAALYEEQGHYEQAAQTVVLLGKADKRSDHFRAHALYIAAAQTAIAQGDLERGKGLLKLARKLGDDNAHFLIAASELAAARGNWSGAKERLWSALRIEPSLAPLVVERLLALGSGGDRSLGDEGLDDEQITSEATPGQTSAALISEVKQTPEQEVAEGLASLQREQGPRLELAVAEAKLRSASVQTSDEDTSRLTDLLATRFVHSPLALVSAANVALAANDSELIKKTLADIVAQAGPLGWVSRSSWQCSACGQRSDDFGWRCQGCRRWSTVATAAASEPHLPKTQPRDRRGQVREVASALQLGLPTPTVASLPMVPRERKSVLQRASAWFGRRSEKK